MKGAYRVAIFVLAGSSALWELVKNSASVGDPLTPRLLNRLPPVNLICAREHLIHISPSRTK